MLGYIAMVSCENQSIQFLAQLKCLRNFSVHLSFHNKLSDIAIWSCNTEKTALILKILLFLCNINNIIIVMIIEMSKKKVAC